MTDVDISDEVAEVIREMAKQHREEMKAMAPVDTGWARRIAEQYNPEMLRKIHGVPR